MLKVRIFISPNGQNTIGGIRLNKILNKILEGFYWGFESQNPWLYTYPAILVRAEQKRGIVKILMENKLFYED